MAAPLPSGVRVDRDLVIPLADGTRLAGDLYRPAAAGPVPVLVSYYPYRKDDIIGSLFEGTRLRLCERGYASVFADMRLDERFTARVRPGRPAGAALTADIGIGVRLPAGERVEVVVRSASSRTATVVEGSVTLDGTSLLHHRWTSQDGPAPDH